VLYHSYFDVLIMIKTLTGLIIILFTKELIVINHDFVIYNTFILLLLISINTFGFLNHTFDNIRLVEKSHINLSSLQQQISYHSQITSSLIGIDCGLSLISSQTKL
jgi:hypothetical protein